MMAPQPLCHTRGASTLNLLLLSALRSMLRASTNMTSEVKALGLARQGLQPFMLMQSKLYPPTQEGASATPGDRKKAIRPGKAHNSSPSPPHLPCESGTVAQQTQRESNGPSQTPKRTPYSCSFTPTVCILSASEQLPMGSL